MSKRSGLFCLLLLSAVFLIVNRAAYKGYFQADEFDTMGWAQMGTAGHYFSAMASPLFSKINFRPTAHFYFHEAILHFGLDFPKYVLVVHLVHLFNVWLIWTLARRLGAPVAGAALGCIFFALHMALFDAFWKPMYIFDVLCATFCLLSVLFYARRWWIVSFVCYWLAYKSKELAVMLPLVLAAYEIWFGKRRWKPLVPFFLASLSFGLQGLILNPNKDNEYTFRFTLAALRASSVFYAGRVLLVPYLGFVLPLAAYLSRNRRTWFGLAMMASLFVPLLFLPGRLLSPYSYTPFTGLAIVLAGVVETTGALPVALLVLFWLPLDLHQLRVQRRATLAQDDEVRLWMNGLQKFAATHPKFDAVVWAGRIPGFADWGVSGAVAVAFHDNGIRVFHYDGPAPPDAAKLDRVGCLVWNRWQLSGAVHVRTEPDDSTIDVEQASGLWQIGEGWNDVDGNHRWTSPRSKAHLNRPPGVERLVMHLIVPWDQIVRAGPITIHVKLNDVALEPRQFDHGGDADAEWDLAPGPSGDVRITIEAEPLYQPAGDALGVAVRSLGFE